MRVIPALDIRDGGAVRLRQGNYEDEIKYHVDPIEVIQGFVADGASLIHVVDLDSARDGTRRHASLIAELCAVPGAKIELGGGIRTEADVSAAFGLGVTRVVMGTAAVEQPNLVCALCETFPGRIALGIDVRDGFVATRGWTEGSEYSLLDLLGRYAGVPVGAIIVTEISRDGMLSGPDATAALQAADAFEAEIVVSGGVGAAEDLRGLLELRSERGRAIDSVILGRALYEGRLTLREAIAAVDRTMPRAD